MRTDPKIDNDHNSQQPAKVVKQANANTLIGKKGGIQCSYRLPTRVPRNHHGSLIVKGGSENVLISLVIQIKGNQSNHETKTESKVCSMFS